MVVQLKDFLSECRTRSVRWLKKRCKCCQRMCRR